MSATIVAAVNDDALLAKALSRSPDIAEERAPLLCQRGAASASVAYNAALDATDTDLLIFVHQDVYLPFGWLDRLLAAASAIEAHDRRWAVLGVYGVAADGVHRGCLWSGDQHSELVGSGGTGGTVASLDEVVLVLRRASRLRFDPGLPHFHLYGTDIVQTALAAQHGAYAVEAPVIHDTVPVPSLAGGYARAYRYMQRKWRDRLPIHTSIASITRSGMPLLKARLGHWRHFRHLGYAPPPRVPDVVQLSRQLGYE